MKVKIRNQIYDSNEEPIMIVLHDVEKEHIKNMPSECMKYFSGPSVMGPDEVKAFMELNDDIHGNNIYIEHNGEWYDYSTSSFGLIVDRYNQGTLDFPKLQKTSKRLHEFEIGSLVKFRRLEDWVKIVFDPSTHCDDTCAFMEKRCLDIRCDGRRYVKYTVQK